MGVLSGLLGNASEVDAGKLKSQFAQVLASRRTSREGVSAHS
jgi:hypothetical protein